MAQAQTKKYRPIYCSDIFVMFVQTIRQQASVIEGVTLSTNQCRDCTVEKNNKNNWYIPKYLGKRLK